MRYDQDEDSDPDDDEAPSPDREPTVYDVQVNEDSDGGDIARLREAFVTLADSLVTAKQHATPGQKRALAECAALCSEIVHTLGGDRD